MRHTNTDAPTGARVATAGLTSYQRHAVLLAVLVAVATTALVPRAAAPWPNVPSFLPAYQTATILCYAVAAYLIQGYFKQTRQAALLHLWGGCVYTAAILLVQFLAFPSAFLPGMRVLGGAQTPSWLWFFWHLGSTGMLFGYAWSEWRQPGRLAAAPQAALRSYAWLTAAALVASVLAVTVFHDRMPVVDVAGDYSRITRTGYAPLIQVIVMLALVLLWRATRFATPISAWLGVAIVALAFDNAITMAGGARLSAGWYVGRLNALLSAIVLLVLYLREVTRVYLKATAMAAELAQANQRLASEHARMSGLFERAPGFMAVLTGGDHRIEVANTAFRRLVGARDVVGKTMEEALPELREQGYVDLFDKVRRDGEAHVGSAMKMVLRRDPAGAPEELYVDVLFQPSGDAGGAGAGIFVQGHDVTEQRQAHLEVDRHRQHLESLVRERTRKLEDAQTALMHAQKLEAIGKLTGGVAHDFNNVLHIINGNLDLIRILAPASDKVHLRCQSAQTAIQRGAKLSSQLLSFARKQPLQPDAVSLPDVVGAIDLLLKRAVGEGVEVEVAADAGLWNVLADPQQLENVILNLALNASDAMGGSGRLVIAMDNVRRNDGEFVHLAFRDSGHGMSEDVKARAFEPFFSTKGVGKGTGLGLSMAYGFVKQSGGHIDIESAPGQGATIHILLPRTERRSEDKQTVSAVALEGGSETVLVVDDEPDILDNVAAMLGDLGYAVLTAASADAALAVVAGQRIDLLLTDVIMPGTVSATELAERTRERHPAVRVLFTSGYTEGAVIHNGRLDVGVNLLSKPYGRTELAAAVRRALKSQAGVRTTASSTPS